MKIRLHPDDCARYGVDEVIDFDPTRIGLREAAALQKVTGKKPDDLFKALSEQDLDALAALVWVVIGRAAGQRPDWDSFDVNAAIVVEDDEEADPGKASTATPEHGDPPSPTTTESDPGSSTS